MSRKLTPTSTLENLRREAKRWLKALHAGDADARTRLERAHPSAPAKPTLRDVQHGLACEHGAAGWTALKREVLALEAVRTGEARETAIAELFTAVLDGDVGRVSQVLDRTPEIVNALAVIPGHTGMRTALHHGVGNVEMVRTLLERGVDPNIRDEGDNAMPLHFAAEREDMEVIRLLIEHGADPVGEDDDHELEVIGWATCFGSGRRDVVDYLLAHGARHNIFSAVATGAVNDIRTIIAASPHRLEARMDGTNHRRHPLHLAVVKKQPASLTALLELGADTGALDAGGLMPLDQAALDGETVMVQRLLDHGAALRLPAAVALGRTDEIERLLREEPECLRPGQRYATLIVRAAARSAGRVIRALLRAGADANVRDDTRTSVDGVTGYTPLHAAAFHGNGDAVAVLLEHGADPNVRDGSYCSAPAGWAAYAGHAAVRDLIVDADIDLFQVIDFDRIDRIPAIVRRAPWLLEKRFGEVASCSSGDGPQPWHTPLAWAVRRDRVDAVRALLEQGAAPIVAPDGRTLLAHAEDAELEEVAMLLREFRRVDATREGRVRWFVRNACPDHGIRGPSAHVVARHTAARMLRRWPEVAHDGFCTAVICGDLAGVEHALAERPDLATEKTGPKGWTPLLYLCFTRLPSVPAASDNALAIARLLLDNGADPNAYFMAGDSSYTPLVGAIGEGEEDRPAHPKRDALVDLLLERGAEPYDIQVLYNIHFHGDALWFLERIHARSIALGRDADWQDPEWRMLDMGGYGSGARYLLEIAIRKGDVALATWLLAHGANPEAAPAADPRFPKRSLYEEALRHGRTAIAELLGRHGATPTALERDAEEAFIAACLGLDRNRVDALLTEHPDVLASPTAIHTAAKEDRADVVELLLDLGAPIEVENEQKQRPLHIAAWHDALRVAQLLIDRGAEIDPVESSWSNTPLDFAVYGQLPRMIELLSHHSRDIWNLVFTGNVERVREVLNEQPDLARVVTKRNATPLMWLPDDEPSAVALVRLFVAEGADPGLRDTNGLTAADHASRRGLEEAAALLREHEAAD